jgi:hypothetical protein
LHHAIYLSLRNQCQRGKHLPVSSTELEPYRPLNSITVILTDS